MNPTPPPARRGPLDGIVVLDLSRVLAGPYCSMLMCELGARVIKIEPPGEGDDARAYGPFVNGQSAYFASMNRGKESIALDLKDPAERVVLDALLARSDVLLENFRPGVMEKLGLGWEALHRRYPRLVYASISGFGQTGPLAQQPGYDMVVQGLSGLMSVTGHPGQPPVRVGVSIGDLGAGMMTLAAINAALYHRQASGEATRIDLSMLDAQVALMDAPIVRYSVTGEVPTPLGSRHPNITPFEAYPTADDPIIIAAGNDRLFVRLAAALELPQLAQDPGYATNALRCQHVERLFEAMAQRLRTRSRAEWIERFTQDGIPHAPIHTVADLFEDEQLKARHMIVDVMDEDAGPIQGCGNPMKFQGFPDTRTRPSAPRLDGHRQALLAELGLAGPDTPGNERP